MKILRLEIKRFGRFADQTFEFADGVNVVLGGNESGKSTIAEAICAVLFDDPSRLTPSISRFANWQSDHPYLLHLEYLSDDKHYRLTKDVSTELSMLEEVETGTRWNSHKEVQEQIYRALGFTERDFFEATAFLRQGDLGRVNRHANLVKDKLERLFNSNKDEVLASRLLEKLSSRIRELEGDDSHPGEIGQLQKRVTGLETELQTCKSKTAELLETRKRVHNNGVELIASQKRFDEQHERFKKSKLAFEASQNLEKERESYLDLARRTREAQEIKNMITSKKETLKSLTKIERADLKTCESLATQRTIYSGKVQDFEQSLEREREAAEQATPGGWYRYFVGGALAAVATAVIVYFNAKDPLYLASAGAAFVVAIAAAGLWISSQRAFSAAQTKYTDAKARLEEERETLRKNVETLDALLRRFKVKDVDEMAESYEHYRDLDRDIKNMVVRYEAILGENNLKDLEIDLAKITDKMNEQGKVFEQYRSYVVSAHDLEELQREVAELDRKLTRLRDESIVLSHKLEFLESGTDIMAPLQERIEDGKRKVEILCNESEQLRIVARYLEEARRKVLKSSIELLEEESSAFLNALTAGTWSKVRLDRHSLACEISGDGVNWYKSADALSNSAADSLHIALRLAMVKVLASDRKPPLVMEDPLVNLDRVRRSEAERLLRNISADYQVIFLTADQQYRDIGDHFCELSASAHRPAQVAV